MFGRRLYPGETTPNHSYFLSCDSIRQSWSEDDDIALAKLLRKHSRPGVTGPLKENVNPGWEAIIGGMIEQSHGKYSVDELKCIIDSSTRQIFHSISLNRRATHPDLWLISLVSKLKSLSQITLYFLERLALLGCVCAHYGRRSTRRQNCARNRQKTRTQAFPKRLYVRQSVIAVFRRYFGVYHSWTWA